MSTPSEKGQFRVLIADATVAALEAQKDKLGVQTENALGAIYVTALAKVPAEKVWEVLALIERYQGPGYARRK